jgi:GTP-binding protein
MRVVEARFVTSAASAEGIPRDGVPHIAFVGRSNVGKSSLINALTRQKLARTSAAPGKTRLANLYRMAMEGGAGGPGRWSVYFADLPGYGYARGGQDSVAELARVAEEYFGALAPLMGRPTEAEGAVSEDAGRAFRPGTGARLALVLHVVDARHPGLEADVNAAGWLQSLGVPRAVAANKVDKLSRAERAKNLRELERTLGMAALPMSAADGEGLDDLWALIAKLSREQP